MGQLRVLRTDDFTGGLNLRADPFQLGENESPDLLNVDIDPRGGFSSRGAFTRINTSAIGSIAAGSFTAEKLYSWQTGTPQLMVAANGKVFYSTGGNFTDTTIATTFADGASFAPWSGASIALYVACGNGAAQMAKWDGSTRTLLTACATGQWQDSLASPTGTHMPKADLVASHVDRLWVANTVENGTAYPNRVRFSHPNFPESWRELDYIDIVGGGSGITALVPFGDALMVFKQNSVHAIYGYDTDTIQVQMLTGSVGTPSSHTVCVTEAGLYFFDWPDGVFFFDGRQFRDVFVPIRPLIQSGVVNGTKLSKVWLGKMANRVWLSLPTGSANDPDVTYLFDPSINAWTRYQLADGSGVAAVCDFVESGGTQRYVALHPTSPYCLQLRADVFQDDIAGTPAGYPSHYTTRWHDAGVISAKKMWRRPDLVVKQPTTDVTLTVQVYHNWEEASARRIHQLVVSGAGTNSLQWNAIGSEPDGIPGWGEAEWGAGAEGATFERGSNLGLARSVQLKISGPLAKEWGVNSISYKYIPRKVR